MEDETEGEDVEKGNLTRRKSIVMPSLPKLLTVEEKKYLLAAERGDMPNVKRILQRAKRKKNIDIDCVDSLGRGALTISIDQENLEMVELLIVMGVQTKDALLHAINVEFVEAVELLLEHEELIHKDGEPYSWQKIDTNIATFTPDITPLILAAHRNNYEILKILLDRGATLPMPHDIKCGCDECITLSQQDSLRQALSRLNEYKALASPSLIALSSSDPILTAFELSWELRSLAFAEPECRTEYLELRRQCQQFAVDLLHQSRSSQELAVILNHDPDDPSPYEEGEHMRLSRLELAIQYKQKKFVSHPNIQQLLAAIWYEGVPGFRRKTNLKKIGIIVKVALLFPFYCMLYIVAPNTETGKLMRKPFMKFLIHASSYLFFLLILILVSQRAEDFFIEHFGTESWKESVIKKYERQRGNPPMLLEYVVLIYVLGFIVEETHEMFSEGFSNYLRNMWNIIDFTRNTLYTAVLFLRAGAYMEQNSEIARNPATAYLKREEWDAFDYQLVAEGLFAAANVFSALKLVHLFSINPHLGPLQISLGRMVIDIVKFFFIYSLVLFAFACGLNQLLWYFSDLERQRCFHLPNGNADFDNFAESCMKWRRFANVFESSQSLFWASFGLVDLSSFELTGIKTYTRFWGLLMFGSYSVINVIVLLNLLIAMMSNSYAIIEEHSDTEWKFARTKLWLSYFEESATLPPPFNLIPTPKLFMKFLGLRKKDKLRKLSSKKREREEKERDYKYSAVMRSLVWRYVTAMHKKEEENPVTEDDVNEIKSDISSFRYEILEVLNRNGMDTSSAEKKEKAVLGKKNKVWERRLMKDFKVSPIASEDDEEHFYNPTENETAKAKFRRIAKLAFLNSGINKWRQVVRSACLASQIGHCHSRTSVKKQQNLEKAMLAAQNLSTKSPDSSRPVTPINLPDFSELNISNLFQNFESFELTNNEEMINLSCERTSSVPENIRSSSFKYILGNEFSPEVLVTERGSLSTSPISSRHITAKMPMELTIPKKEPLFEELEYPSSKNLLDDKGFTINSDDIVNEMKLSAGIAEKTHKISNSPEVLVTCTDGQNIVLCTQGVYKSLAEKSDTTEKDTNSSQEYNRKQLSDEDFRSSNICGIVTKEDKIIKFIDKDLDTYKRTETESMKTKQQLEKSQMVIDENENPRPPPIIEKSETLNNLPTDENKILEKTASGEEKIKCSSVTFSTTLDNRKSAYHKSQSHVSAAPLKTALKSSLKNGNEKKSIPSTLSPTPSKSGSPTTSGNGKSPLASRDIHRVQKRNQPKFGWL